MENSINQSSAVVSILCPSQWSGGPGRPRAIISEDQLSRLIEMGFSYTKIAKMFGVSARTLPRMQIGRNYSSISDTDLDVIQRLVQVKL